MVLGRFVHENERRKGPILRLGSFQFLNGFRCVDHSSLRLGRPTDAPGARTGDVTVKGRRSLNNNLSPLSLWSELPSSPPT